MCLCDGINYISYNGDTGQVIQQFKNQFEVRAYFKDYRWCKIVIYGTNKYIYPPIRNRGLNISIFVKESQNHPECIEKDKSNKLALKRTYEFVMLNSQVGMKVQLTKSKFLRKQSMEYKRVYNQEGLVEPLIQTYDQKKFIRNLLGLLCFVDNQVFEALMISNQDPIPRFKAKKPPINHKNIERVLAFIGAIKPRLEKQPGLIHALGGVFEYLY